MSDDAPLLLVVSTDGVVEAERNGNSSFGSSGGGSLPLEEEEEELLELLKPLELLERLTTFPFESFSSSSC